MRFWILAALGLTAAAAAPLEARSFRQTYGSTTPTADGCAWNLNGDYFVPRRCDSCRYDLYSACKQGHGTSPACRHLHPVHGGYCTPYGACRYLWRDHVYKTFCGCTPWRRLCGPWRLDKCRKHCFALRNPCGDCDGGGWCAGDGAAASSLGGEPPCAACVAGELPNVEPMGGETLGTIPALPQGAGGRGGGTIGGGAFGGVGGAPLPNIPTAGSVAIPGLTPALGLTPPPTGF